MLRPKNMKYNLYVVSRCVCSQRKQNTRLSRQDTHELSQNKPNTERQLYQCLACTSLVRTADDCPILNRAW